MPGHSRENRPRPESRYWQLLLKRLILRGAQRTAKERRGVSIVTGHAVRRASPS